MDQLQHPRPFYQRFARFCVVGCSGVIVDGVAFSALFYGAGCGIVFSKAAAAQLALINNFVWNDVWTFRDVSGKPPLVWRLARFNLICLSGLLLSALLLLLLHRKFHVEAWVSNILAIFASSVWNYGLSARLGWRRA